MSPGIKVNLKNENQKWKMKSFSQMISSFDIPQLWDPNFHIQLLIAMHEMDLAVLWQTSNLQELITGYNIYNI